MYGSEGEALESPRARTVGELFNQAASRDGPLYVALVHEYKRMKIKTKLISSVISLEELINETFLKAAGGPFGAGSTDVDRAIPYLRVVARNHLRDVASRVRRRGLSSVFGWAADLVSDEPGVVELDLLAVRDEVACLSQIVDDFTKKDRELWRLLLAGMDYKEMAAESGSNRHAVTNAVRRLAKKLRARWSEGKSGE